MSAEPGHSRTVAIAAIVILLLSLLSSPAAGKAAGRPLFTAPPTDIENVAGITPLGNTNPGGGHVLAVDHMYLQYPDPSNGGVNAYPVHAMAPGRLVFLQKNQHDGRAHPDYQIFIKHTRTVTVYYDHVHELSPRLEAYLVSASDAWLLPLGPNPGLLFPGRFGAPAPFTVEGGEIIGMTRSYSNDWDVGVIDAALKTRFANKRRYPTIFGILKRFGHRVKKTYKGNKTIQGACFIDYMPSPLREQWSERLLSTPKRCGSHAWDVKGALRGAWFNPAFDREQRGAFEGLEEAALAIGPDNFRPDTHVQFSIGSGTPYSALDPDGAHPQIRRAFHAAIDFDPAARINPDPAEVTRKSGTVCYDLAYDGGDGTRYNLLLLRLRGKKKLAIKLDTSERLVPGCTPELLRPPDGAWTTTYVR